MTCRGWYSKPEVGCQPPRLQLLYRVVTRPTLSSRDRPVSSALRLPCRRTPNRVRTRRYRKSWRFWIWAPARFDWRLPRLLRAPATDHPLAVALLEPGDRVSRLARHLTVRTHHHEHRCARGAHADCGQHRWEYGEPDRRYGHRQHGLLALPRPCPTPARAIRQVGRQGDESAQPSVDSSLVRAPWARTIAARSVSPRALA